jgi:hypothetical protein
LTTSGLAPDEERRIAAELFNHVWELLELPHRTPEQDERMVHEAHASRLHWDNVGGPTSWTVGEWQCSRVYATLGRTEPAIHHGERALAICEEAHIEGFFLAEAYEALARAHAVSGDRAGSERYRELALKAAEAIDDGEDRETFERDMSTLPA